MTTGGVGAPTFQRGGGGRGPSLNKPPSLRAAEEALPHFMARSQLGAGSFGRVFLMEHRVSGARVAVKTLKKERILELGMQEKVMREIRILLRLRHPNVIRLYSVMETSRYILLVMEYAEHGELFDYITQRGRLAEGEARGIFQQIVAGVGSCHAHMVVHRDLKPENILMGGGQQHLNVKVADFGLGNLMEEGGFLRTSCGSPNYAAPEVISGRPYSGPEVDVWGCGVVLYTLLCGRLPFDEKSHVALYQKIKAAAYPRPSHVTPAAQDLLGRMLIVDPLLRATLPEVHSHPWFLPWFLPKNLQRAHEEEVEGEGQQKQQQRQEEGGLRVNAFSIANLQRALTREEEEARTMVGGRGGELGTEQLRTASGEVGYERGILRGWGRSGERDAHLQGQQGDGERMEEEGEGEEEGESGSAAHFPASQVAAAVEEHEGKGVREPWGEDGHLRCRLLVHQPTWVPGFALKLPHGTRWLEAMLRLCAVLHKMGVRWKKSRGGGGGSAVYGLSCLWVPPPATRPPAVVPQGLYFDSTSPTSTLTSSSPLPAYSVSHSADSTGGGEWSRRTNGAEGNSLTKVCSAGAGVNRPLQGEPEAGGVRMGGEGGREESRAAGAPGKRKHGPMDMAPGVSNGLSAPTVLGEMGPEGGGVVHPGQSWHHQHQQHHALDPYALMMAHLPPVPGATGHEGRSDPCSESGGRVEPEGRVRGGLRFQQVSLLGEQQQTSCQLNLGVRFGVHLYRGPGGECVLDISFESGPRQSPVLLLEFASRLWVEISSSLQVLQ